MGHDLWEIVFLDFTRSVTPEESMDLTESVIKMYYEGAKRKKVKTDFWRGEIRTDGKYSCLGCYAGQIYQGELANYNGFEIQMKFILSKKTNPELN
jgi:hypothetical protein